MIFRTSIRWSFFLVLSLSYGSLSAEGSLLAEGDGFFHSQVVAENGLVPTFNIKNPLRIVMLKDNVPFSFVLPYGSATGLYVEYWQLWSETTGIPIKLVPATFAEATRLLNTGESHMLMGLFENPERRKLGSFTLPIHRVSTGLYMTGDEKQDITLADLSSKKIAVQKGSYQHSFLLENFPELKVLARDINGKTLSQLLNKEIDGLVGELPYVNSLIAKAGLTGVFVLTEKSVMVNDVHGFIPKIHEGILPMLDKGILKMPLSTIIALEKKWLPDIEPFVTERGRIDILTPDEKEWLRGHSKFTHGIDQNWAPYEYIDVNGEYVGLSADYIDIVAQSLSVELNRS